ncbi:MAG: aminopeptidase P family protein, partial [Nitrospirae bacterium]|nr:aminopeptidase P family protein [Nitrospirota bacterium]
MKRTTTPQAEVATLFIAASEHDSNLYYATRFMAPDPFIYLEIKGERLMVMSDLEMDRARTQASVDRVLSYSEIEQKAKKQGIKDPTAVDIVHVVLKESKIRRLSVPANFPIIHAARLQERGYSLKPKRDPFYEQRVLKTAEEVRHIEDAQRATEEAVAAAHALLRRAEIKDEQLWLDGEVATSERIKKFVNVKLM